MRDLDRLELAAACLVGLCANVEAPHHKPTEMAKRACDVAEAFCDEVDAREAAFDAKEAAEVSDTEPPPAPVSQLLDPGVLPDELDEDPATDLPFAETERSATKADSPYQADDLARVTSPTV